jgi:rhodanese-related sulfurtransferase
MPVDQLEERLAEVDPDEQPVIVYCRGPYCTFAAEAVEQLRAHGVEAVRLREGYTGWRRG